VDEDVAYPVQEEVHLHPDRQIEVFWLGERKEVECPWAVVVRTEYGCFRADMVD
jgi:hypothetical protein